MMSSFETKQNDNGEFEITFHTTNVDDFKSVETVCRNLIQSSELNNAVKYMCGKCGNVTTYRFIRCPRCGADEEYCY